jgi:ribosomal protein S27AE
MIEEEPVRTSASGRPLCPRCGAEMNFHAEKIDFAAAAGDDREDENGLLAEFHTCGRCRYVLERPAR